MLVNVDCYLCNSKEKTTLYNKKPFFIVKCAKCGLVYTTPRCDENSLKSIYQTRYWKSPCAKDFGYTDYLKDGELYKKTYRKRCDLVENLGRGRVLDVGCSAGFFVAVMLEKNWESYGVDVSKTMISFAKENFGKDKFFCGSIFDVPLEEDSLDLITFWDVVEHLPDPISALKRARSLLKDSGSLIIETQNIDSLWAKVLGIRWQHFKFLEHLYHFSKNSLSDMLAKAGFTMVKWTRRYGGKYVSVDFVIERSRRVNKHLPKVLSPLKSFGKALYINPFDEQIAVAKKILKDN